MLSACAQIVALPARRGQCFVSPIYISILARDKLEISIMPIMPSFGMANLLAGLIFGSVGFVGFVYGKRMTLWKSMFLGLALMIFPYFIANTIALYAIGSLGTAIFFFVRD
jgi:hypothetical protein